MLPTSNNEPIPARAGAVILASASVCPADPDLLWAPLGGKPLLAWSIAACLAIATLDPIILVVAEERASQARDLLAAMVAQMTPSATEPTKKAALAETNWQVVVPTVSDPSVGERRCDATRGGLVALAPDCQWVVVHEATRPLATAALIRAGLSAAVRANTAAIASEPVKETLKRAPGGIGALVAETLPRAQLARAQTPQVYRVADLLAALDALPPTANPADEATIATAAGLPLVAYPGAHDNLRVTSRADLPIIAAMLKT